MTGSTFADILSEKAKADLVSSIVKEGAVYRLPLSTEEGIVGKKPTDDGRTKYIIICGHDREGNAYGFLLINSEVNQHLPKERKEKHIKIEARKYAFLQGQDRYVDCSDLKIISKSNFTNKFAEEELKGQIEEEDMARLKHEAATYKNAKPKVLKRFGLIPEN